MLGVMASIPADDFGQR